MSANLSTYAGQRDHYKAVNARMGVAAESFQLRTLAAEVRALSDVIAEMNADMTAQAAELKALRSLLTGREIDSLSGGLPIGELLATVSLVTGLPERSIMSHRRDLNVVKARQILMWLAHRTTSSSYPEIARAVGGRDHTTVLHAVRRVQGFVDAYRLVPDEDTPFAWVKVLTGRRWRTSDLRTPGHCGGTA